MKKYKFIHIFNANEFKFNLRVVMLINENKDMFQIEEHLFIARHKSVYDKISAYDNSILVEKSIVDIINEYGDWCNWFILHGASSQLYKNIFIRNKYCHKIVWRTWGHDVCYSYIKGQYVKNFAKYIVENVWRHKVREFYAVGIANLVDEINIRKKFGDVHMYRIPYPNRQKDQINDLPMEIVDLGGKQSYNILLGHSGHSNDNHIEILKKLEKFRDEDMQIYMILSYGNMEYIEKVKKHVDCYWKEKVIIIDKFLEYTEYAKLISKMDIAILDGEKSYALGNISFLLRFNKKIFLNRKGVIKEAFDIDNIPYCCTDEIEGMPFAEFVKSLDFTNMGSAFASKTYEESIMDWKCLLDDLNRHGES